MRETTMEDRRKELESLLEEFKQHPERDWTEQRKRAKVLSEMIAAHDSSRD
ncbi:MAG: hypothetical protein KUG65_03510 [Sphingomonadaceae bacterium]|nr:hypothetical protein [Sphingomonadaceae bacterium]